MNKIIKPNGEYITNHFTGQNGNWELIGTVSITDEVMDCQDTFINRNTGVYQVIERSEVYKYAENNSIFLQ